MNNDLVERRARGCAQRNLPAMDGRSMQKTSGTEPIIRCSILRPPKPRSPRVTGDTAHSRAFLAWPRSWSVSPATTEQGTVLTVSG
jgi:hypothetical protein